MEKIKRIFTCKNGHTYQSKEPITTAWAEANTPKFLGLFWGVKQNNICKICSAPIISEDDYVKGKIVMGARRI